MSTKNNILSTDSAVEKPFYPELDEPHSLLFREIVSKLGSSLPINIRTILKQEIIRYQNSELHSADNINSLKYLATINILMDLSLQGWIFDVKEDSLTLRMEGENFDSKEKIRNRLNLETNAQFATPSIQGFIKKMEKTKSFNGNNVSVKNLFGDPQLLLEFINNKSKVCAPYIQLVNESYDVHTGYRLSDIWKYFRYTWSIPYKTMPGRNMYYLVRDSLQPFHPIIGIFALGNSVLNLTVRDNDIGWTLESIKNNIERKSSITLYEKQVSGTNGATVKVSYKKHDESETEFTKRTSEYSRKLLTLLINSVNCAISELYLADLGPEATSDDPSAEYIKWLQVESERLRQLSINNKNSKKPDWETEAKSVLFKRKRTSELAKLLLSKKQLKSNENLPEYERLKLLLATSYGRKAITVALVANRKRKIGSNMMEIIVCGAIPPYNNLLGGKLISILACSPLVIRDYTEKYKNHISEIASRMKGETVIRDSHLAYLGTTSLYAVGSSQYNRIKVPLSDGSKLEFRKMGITEGYGTVFFSSETTSALSQMLQVIDGGKRINHVFGEGTSPRFRLINRGLTLLGIHAPSFLNHYSPRIVYSIDLAKNTNQFLLGYEDHLEYNFDINDNNDVNAKTQDLIEYWYTRWMEGRLENIDIKERLEMFNIEDHLLSNRL